MLYSRQYQLINFYKRLERWAIWTFCILFIILLISVPIACLSVMRYEALYQAIMLTSCGICIISGIVAAWASFSKQMLCKKVPPISDDLSTLGRLIEAWEPQQRQSLPFQTAARFQLLRLLPKLRPWHSSYLDLAHRQRLNRVLAGTDTEFILVVLRALEQIGDYTALPYVQQLADTDEDNNTLLQSAAGHCLMILQRRIELERSQQTLLRASVHTMPPDILLRPASGTTQPLSEADAQLLRPTLGQDGTLE